MKMPGLGGFVNELALRTVLIVEDEWLVRMELAAAFEDAGCIVLESASAEDAITTLGDRHGSRETIDLLITDIRLTGPLTGWDVAMQARAFDPGIAVIYVSANPPAPDRCVAEGIFIEKPALVDRVVAEAQRLVPNR